MDMATKKQTRLGDERNASGSALAILNILRSKVANKGLLFVAISKERKINRVICREPRGGDFWEMKAYGIRSAKKFHDAYVNAAMVIGLARRQAIPIDHQNQPK